MAAPTSIKTFNLYKIWFTFFFLLFAIFTLAVVSIIKLSNFHTKKIAKEEIVVLLKTSGKFLEQKKFRFFSDMIGTYDSNYFLKIFDTKEVTSFSSGNLLLLDTGQCVDVSHFQFKLVFCKESVFPLSYLIAMTIILILALSMAFIIIKKLNNILVQSLSELILQAGMPLSSKVTLKHVWCTVFEIAEKLKLYKFQEIEHQKKLAITELAKKVAHDIRSPVSTLNILCARITDPDIRILQKSAVDQINFIANSLLQESKKATSPLVYFPTEEGIVKQESNVEQPVKNSTFFNFLKKLENEYEFKKSSLKREIGFEIDYSSIIKANLSNSEFEGTLYRILNNFIQNSVEATTENGKITICVFQVGTNVEISVNDNGKGIPRHVLQKLGSEQISYGKNSNENQNLSQVSGSGIALYNAKKDLTLLGAELKIYSVEGKGTTVSIVI